MDAKQRGKILKEAREKTGYTQAQITEKIGMSKSYYIHLEQGFNDIAKASGAVKILIEQILNVDVESLS